MSPRHVVVDGSNIATEGRSLPSLEQLDQAVREFLQENPEVTLTVVVDATFGHRIEEFERQAFEEAEAANEVVSPPAGAIGRGDAFLLRIADKVGATVLSNDSFQEFHGEYGWLFDEGRLIGGKPVPGIGWIFTPRTPVRGPKSREAVKEAKRKKAKEAVPPEEPGLERAAKSKEAKPKRKQQVERAIVDATDEAIEPESSKATRRRRRRSATPPSEPVNEPASFFNFITAHPLGSTVEGLVESFSSHGAFVDVEGARCYIPLSAMADPAPRAAKEVLTKGETRPFVVQALDPPRRGIELALPEFAHVAGRPTEETVEAEIEEAGQPAASPKPRGRTRKAARPALEPLAAGAPTAEAEPELAAAAAAPTPVRRSRKKAAAPTPAAAAPPPPEKAPPEKAPPVKAAPAAVAAAAEPAPTKRPSRKRPTAPAAAASATPAASPVTAEPAPGGAPFRARRSTKKAAAPVVEPAPPKKAAAARRTAKAAAAPAAPAPVVDDAAKKAAARKTAAKKAAATRAAKKAAAPR
ncbi:MAG: hypothetical protein QOG64_1756 [Acidimicrobiaceae bacterium]|nr:hypothetical protein [Acidimicrobiaceae bacterium]